MTRLLPFVRTRLVSSHASGIPKGENYLERVPNQTSDAELSHHGLIKCLYELLKEYTKTIEFSYYLAEDNKKDFHLYHIFHYLVQMIIFRGI